MKKLLTILLLSTSLLCAQNKSVTQKTTDKSITDNLIFKSPQILTITGDAEGINSQLYLDGYGQINGGQNSSLTIGKTHLDDFNNFTFNNVPAMIATKAEGNGKHAILGRTVTAFDGIGVIGWSSSGAAAVKAKQDSYFTSPAMHIVRNGENGGYLNASSNALTKIWLYNISNISGDPLLSKAIEIGNDYYGSLWSISQNGAITRYVQNGAAENEFNYATQQKYFYGSQYNYNFGQNYNYNFGYLQWSGNDHQWYAIPNFWSGIKIDGISIDHTASRGFYNSSTNVRVHSKYIGAFNNSNIPSSNNIDGGQPGDTYFNSSDNRMYISTPNGWRAITDP